MDPHEALMTLFKCQDYCLFWRVSTLTPEDLVLGHQRLKLFDTVLARNYPLISQGLKVPLLVTCSPSFGPLISHGGGPEPPLSGVW